MAKKGHSHHINGQVSASLPWGGKDGVILHVNQDSPGAIRLYERLRFKAVRIRGAFEK